MTTARLVLRTALLAGVLAAVAVPVQTAAAAAPAGAAELESAKVDVTMTADEPDTVEATYRLANPATLPDRRITHLVVAREGSEITSISPGRGVADLQRGSGASAPVSVTLSPRVGSYTVRYEVDRSDDTYAIPLLVPDLATARGAQVRIRVLLPPGEQATGTQMPSFRESATSSGRTRLVHTGGSLPAAVIAQYGAGAESGPAAAFAVTPFGVPFDTAVLAGLILALLAFALAGRGRHSSQQHQERR